MRPSAEENPPPKRWAESNAHSMPKPFGSTPSDEGGLGRESPQRDSDPPRSEGPNSTPQASAEGVFVELFAGAGGLTSAVRRLGLAVVPATDFVPSGRQGSSEEVSFADLLDNATYDRLLRAAKRGEFRWLHGGPPCKSFSRARRRDEHGNAPMLRSIRFPAGLPGIKTRIVEEGNELAKRFARIAAHSPPGRWLVEP